MNEPDSDREGFTEHERITANLRLRSVSPASRTLLGLFAFIPPAWRGPVAIVALLLISYLAIHFGPGAFKWIHSIVTQ